MLLPRVLCLFHAKKCGLHCLAAVPFVALYCLRFLFRIHDQIMARTAVMPKQGTSRRSLQLRADKSVSNSDCVQYVSEQSHKNKRRKPTSAINFNCGASTSSNLEVEIAASHGNSVGQASYQRRKGGPAK
ncbi:hypothetical protein RchiOBHm_Chr3g0456041 [Rosa chinensis]|uniref:Uncharacterized protein n=1 Tax=Rosa chinensis TaxID=74649 RepID=A0A2P6R793_ROSCH|nr:hypothetical protein RchiOBHm_Chr3g0456041 [Rosa chinensis]